MEADGRIWYYAWLPGPWLVAHRSTGRDALNRRQHVLDLACEYCGHEVVVDAEDRDRERHAAAVSAARAHWESHASGDLELTFFSLPGVGDLKAKLTGTWAELLLRVPYLMKPGDPIPPPEVVDEVLAGGESFAGMSGGCEWPRHILSDAEHAGLRDDLAARGLLDVPTPDWVRTRDDYQDWRFSRRWRCTVDAVVAWRREGERLDNALAELRRAGAGPAELEAVELEKRKLHDPQTWARAFDTRD